jgi:UPF0716 family protein affecting phage T7 exclusion
MRRLPWFYPLLAAIGLLPWTVGAVAYGKTGLIAGLITSFIGIMVLTDANRRHAAAERRRMIREMKRGR